MERAVKDPNVSRVLILCDPVYATKADQRVGGVGTETLIISPDVYQEARQEKFIPVLMQRSEDGSAPTDHGGQRHNLWHKAEGPRLRPTRVPSEGCRGRSFAD